MTITIFGLVWSLIILWAIYKGEKYLIYILLIGMLFQANNVLIIGEKLGIGPQIVTSVVYIIISIFPIRFKFGIHIEFRHIMSILFVGIMFYSSFINGRIQEAILYISMVLFYTVCANRLYYKAYIFSCKELNGAVYNIAMFIVCVGMLQFTICTNILPRLPIFTEIFWNDNIGSMPAYYISYYPRIFSTFLEPSYFAPFAVGAFYFLCCTFQFTKKHCVIMGLLLIEIILTKSSTAYGCLLICGVMYIIVTKNYKALKILIPSAIFTLMITWKFTDLLEEVILEKSNTGSAWTRSNLNKYAWQLFQHSPILGNGFSSARASSVIPTILAEMGVVGLVIFVLFLLSLILRRDSSLFQTKEEENFALGTNMFLISAVCAQVIAIPDMHFCVFWFAVYLVSLASGQRKKTVDQDVIMRKIVR